MRAGIVATHLSRQRSREDIERLYNDDDDEDRGMLCCSRICLFIIGVVMVGVGAHFLSEAETPERQEKVIKYDQTVYEWNHAKKAQLAASSFNLTVAINGNSKYHAELVVDTSDDQAIVLKDGKQDASKEISTYTPMKFNLGPSKNLLGEVLVDFSQPQTAQFTIEARHGKVTNKLPLAAFDLHKERKKSLYGSVGAKRQHCNGMHGNIDHSHGYLQCLIYEQLQSICVELELDTDQKWQLSPASQDQLDATAHMHRTHAGAINVKAGLSYGCDIKHDWHPVHYNALKLPLHSTTPTDSKKKELPKPEPAAFGTSSKDFDFTVRSSADPFLELETLTDGTLYFGLSQEEQRSTGIVCLVVGLLLLVSPAIYMWYCWRRCRDEHKAESEPLAFTGVVSSGNGGSGSSGMVRRRRMQQENGEWADVPVLSGGMSGDAYISEILEDRRRLGMDEGYDDHAEESHENYDPDLEEGDSVVPVAELKSALEPFADSPKKVPRCNVVPVDDEGVAVREMEMTDLATTSTAPGGSGPPIASLATLTARAGEGSISSQSSLSVSDDDSVNGRRRSSGSTRKLDD